MNPALFAAVNASNGHQPSVDDIVGQLKKARALSATTAITLENADSAKIDEAIGLGLVIRSADGRLHVNEIAVADRMQSHGWILLVVLLVGASLVASIVALIAL